MLLLSPLTIHAKTSHSLCVVTDIINVISVIVKAALDLLPPGIFSAELPAFIKMNMEKDGVHCGPFSDVSPDKIT